MAITCSHCGKINRDKAMFCLGCAARLGAEPTDASAFGALPAAAAPQREAGLDPSDAMLPGDIGVPPAPVPGPTRTGFKMGWVGLLLLAVWGAYMVGAGRWVLQPPITVRSETPEPRPAADAPAATAATAATAALSAAGPSAAQASAGASTAVPKPDPETAKAPDTLPAPSADMSMQSLERLFGAPPDAATPAPRRPGAPQSPAMAAREARRPRAQQPADVAATEPGWAAPAREPANTAAPSYSDAGPPIVAGPGPGFVSAPATQDARAPALPRGAADAGPPVGPGPGPRYDFSSPGAVPR
jgi:hypothetical protein